MLIYTIKFTFYLWLKVFYLWFPSQNSLDNKKLKHNVITTDPKQGSSSGCRKSSVREKRIAEQECIRWYRMYLYGFVAIPYMLASKHNALLVCTAHASVNSFSITYWGQSMKKQLLRGKHKIIKENILFLNKMNAFTMVFVYFYKF